MKKKIKEFWECFKCFDIPMVALCCLEVYVLIRDGKAILKERRKKI